MEKEYDITIKRNEVAISAMFSLFEVIHQIEQDWVTVYCHDKKTIINLKKDSVPVKLDYKGIEEKFYKWKFSEKETLTYSAEESKIFTELWFLANEQLAKQTYDSGVAVRNMNLFFKSIVHNLVHVIYKEEFD